MSNNLIKDLKIAIIGGGPVGLTLANILSKNGALVKVFERDLSVSTRLSGGTLDIHKGSGQIALDKAGVLNDYYMNSRAVVELKIDKDGIVLEKNIPTDEERYIKPEIDRSDLRNILLKNLPQNCVLWDSQVVRINENGSGHDILLQNGSTNYFDFVVIANGGNSNLRKIITEQNPIKTNHFALMGEINNPIANCPEIIEAYGESNFVVFGDNKLISTQIKTTGDWAYYIAGDVSLLPNNMNSNNLQEMYDFIDTLFSGWSKNIIDFLKAAKEFKLLELRVMPTNIEYKKHTNITMIGDAAHLMPPYAGKGVNVGLMDVDLLSDNLLSGKFENLDSAIKDYEEKMKIYASEFQQLTALLEQASHSDNPLFEIEKIIDHSSII